MGEPEERRYRGLMMIKVGFRDDYTYLHVLRLQMGFVGTGTRMNPKTLLSLYQSRRVRFGSIPAGHCLSHRPSQASAARELLWRVLDPRAIRLG